MALSPPLAERDPARRRRSAARLAVALGFVALGFYAAIYLLMVIR